MIEAPDRRRTGIIPQNHFTRNRQVSTMIEFLRHRIFYDCDEHERFHAIFLDENRSILSSITFCEGTRSKLSLRTRDLFVKALSVGSRIMVIAHNHPSGDCRPSKVDVEATARIAAISSALDIDLADHLIFTRRNVYSMRAGGHL